MMDYQPMIPPFEEKPFKDMDKTEAQTYFDWYISVIPERLEMLREYYEVSGGGSQELLNFNPESLTPLWKWYIPLMKMEKKSKDELRLEFQQYPKWLKSEVLKGKFKISTASKAIADDISIYFAEVVIKNFSKAKWGFMTKPKSYIAVNQPILICFNNNTSLEPELLIQNLCYKIMDGEKKSNALFDLFKVWEKYDN
jgi:hypothetical protein